MFYNAWHLPIILVSIFNLLVSHKIILHLTLDIILDSMNKAYMKYIFTLFIFIIFPIRDPHSQIPYEAYFKAS